MVINYFNMVRISILPLETYAPSFIVADSVLTFSVPGKAEKFISWVQHQRL
jgi:hypothetical protein